MFAASQVSFVAVVPSGHQLFPCPDGNVLQPDKALAKGYASSHNARQAARRFKKHAPRAKFFPLYADGHSGIIPLA